MRDIEETVYTTVSRALLAGRLTPGTPLRESALAEVFGISRERIRKILQRLGTNRLIELVPNRGAFVAAPSLEQAREIYEARRIVETGIVSHLAPTLAPAEAQRLERHLQRETEAVAAGDRAESVRLSAEFHTVLAAATGNHYLVQQMQELVSRTSMLVAAYESAGAAQCACDEHRDIFSALIRGDSAGAAKAMRSHLSLVETRLRPRVQQANHDAAQVLREIWAGVAASSDTGMANVG